jgi:hypothetical protein
MDPLDWITLVVGVAAYSLGAYTFYHCFFDKPGGHHNIVDPKIQTTRVVRLGSGLKGGRDGEKTGQA